MPRSPEYTKCFPTGIFYENQGFPPPLRETARLVRHNDTHEATAIFMRLTLRTLLAWLDNVLPAETQKQLGDKVTASPVAQQLVARIRGVVERPQVSAPSVMGKGLATDANSVAEYLDNMLAPDRLQPFERICIESDVHLAEVAACHTLLAQMNEDPTVLAPLDKAGRARLLAAMQHLSATAEATANREHATARNGVAAPQASASIGAQKATGGLDEIQCDSVLLDAKSVRDRTNYSMHGSVHSAGTPPRARSQKASLGAWAAAVFAMALLVILGFFLVRAIGGSRRPPVPAQPAPPVAAAKPANAGAILEKTNEEKTTQSDATQTDSTETDAAIDAALDGDALPDGPAVVHTDPQPRAPNTIGAPVQTAPQADGVEVTETNPGEASPTRVPRGDAMAIAAIPTPAAVPVPVDLTARLDAGLAPVGRSEIGIGFVGRSGLLLHKIVDAGQSAWVPFVPDAAMAPPEELLVPPGFHAEFNVQGVTINLLPRTKAKLSVDADGTPRLEIVFGRAIVRASRRDAYLGMNAGQLIGTVIAGLIEPIAIYVELNRSGGANPAVDPTRVRAGIISVEGGFVWRQGEQLPVEGDRLLEGIAAQGMVESRNSIEWDSLRPTMVTVARQRELPEWTKSATRSDPLEKSACERLAARVAARAAASLPLDQDLREMAAEKNGRVEDKQLAVSTLALLGEFNELVEVLCASAPGRKLEARQWTVLEAATVPLALSRGTIAADKLRAAFETHSPHGKAEWLFAMARGFTDDDLTKGAAADLVKSLEDGELVVRRYAFKCLTDIARSSETDKLRYRPDGMLESRREGVQWWKGQLDKGAIRHSTAAVEATGS